MLAAKIGYFRATAHPEALAWQTRVIANGGTVSASTLAAVSNFCNAIQTAGIRDRFLRLNLLAGNSIAAALVPLYRGKSLGGTQFGGTTDTNINFVAGDYTETGSTGGLKGNGSSKYLQTGFAPQSFSSAGLAHVSVSASSLETTGFDIAGIASYDGAAAASYYGLEVRSSSGAGQSGNPGGFVSNFNGLFTTAAASRSHLLVSRTASASASLYSGGTAVTSSTLASGGAAAASSRQFYVFALNNNGTPQRYTAGRVRMYSLGDPMTASQVTAFTNAVVAFNTALGRA